MRLTISEVLTKVEETTSEQDKINTLRRYDSYALRSVLKHTFDPEIRFALPEGAPPYKPSVAVESPNMLQHEAKKFYIFVEGGYPGLKQVKREGIFIQLLESVDPLDAKLLLQMKDKNLLDYPSVTPALTLKAFPGLFFYEEPAPQDTFPEDEGEDDEDLELPEDIKAAEEVLVAKGVDTDENAVDPPKKPGNPSFTEEFTCPHCGKTGKGPTFKRWHFDNCKAKKK